MSSAPALAPNVLRQYLDPMSTSVDFFVGNLPFLDELSLRVGLPRRYLSLAVAAFAATFVLFGLGQSLLCTAVGVLYPAYMSMKALESRPLVPDSMVQWLTYWVCYSIFSSLEVLGDHLLYWIPFYYLLKIVFLVWLMHPTTRGANKLYDAYLHAAFARYSTYIDSMLARLSAGASTAGVVAGRVAGVVMSEANKAAVANAPPQPAFDPAAMFGVPHRSE